MPTIDTRGINIGSRGDVQRPGAGTQCPADQETAARGGRGEGNRGAMLVSVPPLGLTSRLPPPEFTVVLLNV